ncbi:hypothetical protein QWX90_11515, partial [Neisseria gonorrhoeae]
CKPLKDKPPGLIRAAVENHLPLDLFEIQGLICLIWQMTYHGRSRQVDGRCLVSILPSLPVASAVTVSS